MHKPLLAVLATAFLAACSSVPKDRTEPLTRPTPAGAFEFAAGKRGVVELIDATAKYLGVNILTDRNEVLTAQPLDLQTDVRLQADEIDDFVGNLLWSRGFVMVPRDVRTGTYEVISMQGPRAREALGATVARTPEEILERPNLRVPVSTSVALAHTNAVVVTNALRPFFAAQGGAGGSLTLGAGGASNTLLLTGIQCDVARALQAIRSVDVPPGDATGLPMPSAKERIDELERQVEAMQKRIDALEKRATSGQD